MNNTCDYKCTIWFNHWFSAIASSIIGIKKVFPNMRIIASNKRQTCVYAKVADEFYIEPSELSEDDYINWAIDFCKKHAVNIFFVKNNMLTVSYHLDKFKEIGVDVVCDTFDKIDIFNSKSSVYELLSSKGYTRVPTYYVANTVEEFRASYKKITQSGKIACLKFNSDEGAASFRVVTDKRNNYNSMFQQLYNLINYDSMCEILKDGERQGVFKPLMVMPKLDKPEISVDCYFSPSKGLVTIPRYKIDGRVTKIEQNKLVQDDCHFLNSIFEFKAPFNVQYRWEDGELKLLEINTRLSGGVHLSSMAGFSIPNQVVADICGINIAQSIEDIYNCQVSNYEYPVML